MQANELTPNITVEMNARAPPVPQTLPDWIAVSLETEYYYDDLATISWYGRPRTGAQSPFNPLYTWTKEGTIIGGIWEGNPGNATITAIPWDNQTTALEVSNFLNYTMEHYVRFTSWPSLSIFNFTQYENSTFWEFNDAIASHAEFLNTTFYLVNNATKYLMNGFNATGIAARLTEYRIQLHWYEGVPDAEIQFNYTITDATELKNNTYIFSLGRAMGLTAPLNLTGTGTLTLNGPATRMILNGTPTDVFTEKVFPYYPIGIEEYSFVTTQRDFDYRIWYIEPESSLTITREFSTTALNRGDLLSIKITVINTGDVPFNQIIVSDVQAIETGIFQLVEGVASKQVFDLQTGANTTLEYTARAQVTGLYDYPAVYVAGIDFFTAQHIFTSSTETLTIGNGLLPSEVGLIQIGIVIIIITIALILLYRFRRRIF